MLLNNVSRWDRHFLEECFHIAKLSKDPSTKCGAVIVRPNRTVASQGFNGFPKNMRDDPELYNNRDIKYDRTVHSEMNSLIYAREPLDGYTLYTSPVPSCSRCCIHMLQAGISRFVAPQPTEDFLTRWADSLKRTKEYILEAGATLDLVDINTWTYV